jgi:hypothetical protein
MNQDDRDIQDSECGAEMEYFKANRLGTIKFFKDSDFEDIQLGDSSHLATFLEADDAIPGQIPYMKKSEWRRGEEALKAYKPLWKILKYGNDKPFQKFSVFLRETESALDKFAKNWDENKKKAPTHVTMCGSNFAIADGKDEKTFLEIYAALVSTECRCYFVERPTEVYRYFCDFDFKQLVRIPDKTIEAAAMVVQSVVKTFYPSLKDDENALRSIVCTTDAKRVPASGSTPELIKTGMHILWPGLLVSVDTALNMRESMLVKMQNVFGLRVEPNNSWEDVIDVSVYPDLHKKGSGLRMLGSCKSVTCSSCKGLRKLDPKDKDKNGADCPKCKGVGKLDEGRPYFPLMVLTTSGKRDVKSELHYLDNMHDLIVDTKIRTPAGTQPTAGYVLPDGAPVYMASEPGRIRRQGGTDVIDQGSKVKSTIGSLPFGQKFEVSRSDPVWLAIENMITKHPCGMYSQIIVSQIATNAKRAKYTAHINGPYSHYCQNKGSVHSSNRVFFEFDCTGFVQKCFGNKQGIHGPCGPTYRSSTEPLSPTDLEILFPAAKNTFLKALEACRKNEDEEKEEETAFLGRKMRTLLLAGDYLSNLLFGNAHAKTGAKGNNSDLDEGELCLWSRTLRNEGRFFVNVGSFSSDKMDSYVEIDSSALGIRKGAAQLLGFLNEPEEGKALQDEEEKGAENQKTFSLALLTRQMFGALDNLLFDVLDLDQTELRRSHLPASITPTKKTNYEYEYGGFKLREYDPETMLLLL